MTKIAICTPVFGKPDTAYISLAYHQTSARLLRSGDFELLGMRYFVNCDLVRARSRAVRIFLETECTHLLFWDEDVAPHDIGIVRAMVELNKDVIAIPYPRKRLDWGHVSDGVRDEAEQARLGRQGPDELEALALDWPHRLAGPVDPGQVLQRATHVGMGFTLIQREMLEKMAQWYAQEEGHELVFTDACDGQRQPTVALFQLMIRDGLLLSEDYSFCQRCTDIGGEIHVLPVPAAHIGTYAFGSTVTG
jgi:hypothetical protein